MAEMASRKKSLFIGLKFIHTNDPKVTVNKKRLSSPMVLKKIQCFKNESTLCA